MRFYRSGYLALRKNHVVLLLILIAILGLANYLNTYSNQLSPIPNSTFLPTPRRTMEPTLPPSQPPSQQEVLEPSEPASPIVITSSFPVTSTQPVPNLKLSVYSLDPFTNQFQPLIAIDWSGEGPLLPGLSRNSSRVYFRNEGDTPVTLYLSTSGWIFKDLTGKVLAQDYKQYSSLSWDYDNSIIAVNETRPITFTLTTSTAIVDVARFLFEIVVTMSY